MLRHASTAYHTLLSVIT